MTTAKEELLSNLGSGEYSIYLAQSSETTDPSVLVLTASNSTVSVDVRSFTDMTNVYATVKYSWEDNEWQMLDTTDDTWKALASETQEYINSTLAEMTIAETYYGANPAEVGTTDKLAYLLQFLEVAFNFEVTLSE